MAVSRTELYAEETGDLIDQNVALQRREFRRRRDGDDGVDEDEHKTVDEDKGDYEGLDTHRDVNFVMSPTDCVDRHVERHALSHALAGRLQRATDAQSIPTLQLSLEATEIGIVLSSDLSDNAR